MSHMSHVAIPPTMNRTVAMPEFSFFITFVPSRSFVNKTRPAVIPKYAPVLMIIFAVLQAASFRGRHRGEQHDGVTFCNERIIQT